MSIFPLRQGAALLALFASIALANGDSVRDYARAPAFAYPALSPSGTRVSYVDQIDGEQVVFVRSLDHGDAFPTLRLEPPNERIRWCGWADDRYVLCGTTVTARRQHAIAESTRLYSIDASTRTTLELNVRQDASVRDQVIDLIPLRPGFVLLQQDTDRRGFPEVVELDVASGKTRTIVRANPPIRSWMTDGRGQVRLGLSYDDQRAALFVRKSEEWQPFIEQSLSDPEAIGPLAFGASESELYVLKHHRGRAALFRLDLARHASPTLLFADPMFDISGPVLLQPTTRELLGVRYQREAPATQLFAASERERQQVIDGELPGVINEIIARSLDASRLLVRSSSDTNPPSFYSVETKSRRIRLLGHAYPTLESQPLAPMQPIMYAARDGQRIPGYLTRQAQHAGPGPAIVLPHGGPETRDVREFDPLLQFLVARGYAVLQMNYRGSLGYGAGFAAAGAQQWGGVIHNDITDGARWLIEQRIADPQRLCIVGSSFGGYTALLGAARESEWYACAVSFGGTSDLLAFSEYTRRLPDAAMWRERLGEDARALWQMSPLAWVRRIETPVLVMHGRRDAVVPISQARRLARSLERAGKPHRLLERSDCDHEMTAESCRLAIFTALEEFVQAATRSE